MKLSAFFLIFTLILSSLAEAAPLYCKDLFFNKPTTRNIIQGLKLIPLESASLFYELSWGVNDIKDYLIEKDAFNESEHSPIPLQNKKVSRMGGTALFQNNIFAEQYFRIERFNIAQGEPLMSSQELSNKQPWLMWNEKDKKYVLKIGSPNKTLLSSYTKNGKVKIYRGTDESSAKIFDQAIREKSADSILQLFNEKTDSLFFSTTKQAAIGWHKGYVVEIEIDAELLNNENDAYVGVEYNYVEVAIINPDLIRKAISSLVIHKMTKP